jgi:hypothetical protein
MAFSKIRLELARDHDFTAGSRDRGYEFVARLSDQRHILAPVEQHSERCRVSEGAEAESCSTRRFFLT